MIRYCLVFVLVIAATALGAASPQVSNNRVELTLIDGECWWGGNIADGLSMPFKTGFKVDLRSDNKNNQQQPLLLSSKGRWLWADGSFAFEITDTALMANADGVRFHTFKAGQTLRQAYLDAAKRFYHFNGEIPDESMFLVPQWNTWIEFGTNQTQAGVLDYAQKVLDNGFPKGILMIDDRWQSKYGDQEFDAAKFSDPAGMMKTLKQMGFKLMLWVHPFVHDDAANFQMLRKKGYLLRSAKTGDVYFTNWWNGKTALLDLTHPGCYAWYSQSLRSLQDRYGVDGFKLDGGDVRFYRDPDIVAFDASAKPETHMAAFAKVGLDFRINEYRACYGLGGAPLAQRLGDKSHHWHALERLIPEMMTAGLMGYSFSCPDLIGGGSIGTLNPQTDPSKIDRELIVRMAQVHALMPMMQFSVAPWRVLNEDELAIVSKASKLHEQFGPRLLALAKDSAETTEPMIRCMEYNWPGQGYERIVDQFAVGSDMIVAPVIKKSATHRTVVIPEGTWRSDDGKQHQGPATIEIKADLSRLIWFERVTSTP